MNMLCILQWYAGSNQAHDFKDIVFRTFLASNNSIKKPIILGGVKGFSGLDPLLDKQKPGTSVFTSVVDKEL
jgi:hypothetical protein